MNAVVPVPASAVSSLRGAAEALWEPVAARQPGFTVEVLAQIDSTNSELMRRARAGQTDAVLLVAEHQLAGRGRLGRDWQSEAPAGELAAMGVLPSLTFSLGLALPDCDLSGLSLAVGLTVARSLHPDLRLKWPNDVLLQGRKLGGILIETAQVDGVRYLVIGVGINLLPRPAAGLRLAPAALNEVLPQCSAASALQALVPPLVEAVQRFAGQGFAAFHAAYHALDALYGQPVQTSAGLAGVARGVDASGALLLHTEHGVEKISSAEVSVRATPPEAA